MFLFFFFGLPNLTLRETTPEFISLNSCQNFTMNRSHKHTQTKPLYPFDDFLKLALFNQMCHGAQVLKTLFFSHLPEVVVVGKEFCGLHWQATPEPF